MGEKETELAAVVAEFLEHFMSKCRQLKELLEEACKHARCVYWASHRADRLACSHNSAEQAEAPSEASEALDSACNTLVDIESQAMRLRCMLQVLQQRMDSRTGN